MDRTGGSQCCCVPDMTGRTGGTNVTTTKGVTTTAYCTSMATTSDPGKSSVLFTRIDAARLAHEGLAQLLLSRSRKLRPTQWAPIIMGSSVADGSVEGVGSRAYSLSLINFACVLSFTMWCFSFLFPWSRDGIVWNCTYVMNVFCFRFDQGWCVSPLHWSFGFA